MTLKTFFAWSGSWSAWRRMYEQNAGFLAIAELRRWLFAPGIELKAGSSARGHRARVTQYLPSGALLHVAHRLPSGYLDPALHDWRAALLTTAPSSARFCWRNLAQPTGFHSRQRSAGCSLGEAGWSQLALAMYIVRLRPVRCWPDGVADPSANWR